MTTVGGAAGADPYDHIFGAVDAQKLQSSMTLFSRAAPERPQFAQVLERYFDGTADPGTELLI